MLTTILKILAAAGLLLNLVLVASGTGRLMKTENGRERWKAGVRHIPYNAVVGAVSNFLDVFGIGSYATASSAFKLAGSVPDGDIPGTLSAGHTLPVCAEAILFAALSGTDGLTMAALTAAAVIGSFLGAKLVTKLNIQGVRLMMGTGMVIMGAVMLLRVFEAGPFGIVGNGLGLSGLRLAIAVMVQLLLGMLMNIGAGLYAPCMALCTGLGMSVSAALPIVMMSSALLMAFGSGPQFLRSGRYDPAAVWSQMAGGIIGVLVAYFFVRSLDVKILTMVISAVVLVTAVMFFRAYEKGKPRRRKA